MNRWLAALVSLVLVTVGVTAVPAPAHAEQTPSFKDLKGHEWAIPYVSEVQAKGLMQGTGDGTFEPDAALTRAQALTISLRLMELEADVKALGHVPDNLLPFADRAAIPDWARAYAAVAVKKQILPLAEDGLLRPGENASRLWVSVLLVRALGLENEAQAKMGAKLPFHDASLVPTRLTGYAAVAVEQQLFQGFPDGTFRPNDSLTRAQAAAILSRTDSKRAEQGKHRSGTLYGELYRVDAAARQIKLALSGGGYQYVDVATNAALFIQEQSASLADFQAGTAVTVVLGTDGKAVLITAKQQKAAPVTQPARTQLGYVKSVIPSVGEKAGTITVKLYPENYEQSFTLAASLQVDDGYKPYQLTSLRSGDKVELTLQGTAVTRVKFLYHAAEPVKTEPAKTGEGYAYLTELYYSDGKLAKVAYTQDGKAGHMLLAAGAQINLNGYKDIRVGDKLYLKWENGAITYLKVFSR